MVYSVNLKSEMENPDYLTGCLDTWSNGLNSQKECLHTQKDCLDTRQVEQKAREI